MTLQSLEDSEVPTAGTQQQCRFYVEGEKALGGQIDTEQIDSGKQLLSSDEDKQDLVRQPAWGLPAAGPGGSQGPGVQQISGPVAPPRLLPSLRGLGYMNAGDLDLIPSLVGCPPVSVAPCGPVGKVSSGKASELARPFIRSILRACW